MSPLSIALKKYELLCFKFWTNKHFEYFMHFVILFHLGLSSFHVNIWHTFIALGLLRVFA